MRKFLFASAALVSLSGCQLGLDRDGLLAWSQGGYRSSNHSSSSSAQTDGSSGSKGGDFNGTFNMRAPIPSIPPPVDGDGKKSPGKWEDKAPEKIPEKSDDKWDKKPPVPIEYSDSKPHQEHQRRPRPRPEPLPVPYPSAGPPREPGRGSEPGRSLPNPGASPAPGREEAGSSMDQDWRLVNQEGRGLPALGDGCASGRSGMICLGLKYVVYRDPQGYPIESEDDVIRNVQEINELWRDCGISFQVDEFLIASPSGHRLMYRTSDHRELNWIRREFDDRQTLLVVTTGPWDRSGSLGNSYANAWTSLPGEGVYGVVLERSVGGTANVIAHELGHYLSLDHSDDPRNLMHPLIYRNSATLTRAECNAARKAAQEFWVPMIR